VELQNKIIETIKTEEIQNISADIIETIIDSTIENGLIKDLPIIGSIVGLSKGIISIQDRLFTKKLLKFLLQLKSIPEFQRRKQIEKIEKSSKNRIKVGEKILYIIQDCNDHIKAEFVGLLFAAYLQEEIDYESFNRCSDCIIKAFVDDIFWHVENDYEKLSLEESQDLINCGLFEMSPSVYLEDNTHDEYIGTYTIEGYDETYISTWGKTIRKILKGKISS